MVLKFLFYLFLNLTDIVTIIKKNFLDILDNKESHMDLGKLD